MARLATIALGILLAAALCPALRAQIRIDDKPRRYLLVQVEGANREWEVRPRQILTASGATIQGATEADLQPRPERWETTGLPRRYRVDKWKEAFGKYCGPAATSPAQGARFYFYAMNPRQPNLESGLNIVDARKREYWVPAQQVTVKAYPSTWVDIFEGYVAQFSGEERQRAVKEWEAAHRDIIRNADDRDDGFTQEERNEFARFYQGQFVFIRDRDPKLHTIYDELVAFHRERGNLDAALSTYLDGLRSGVPSPHKERFNLEVGRILVQRLRLLEDAQSFLAAAGNHAEARYLLAVCLHGLGKPEAARKALEELVTLVQTPPAEPLVLELTAEEEVARASLLLSEVEYRQGNLVAASTALARIPTASAYYQDGRLLYAAALLYQNDMSGGGDKTDPHKAREAIRALPLWQQAQDYLQPKPGTLFPLNPSMARALVLYAQTDAQYREISSGKKPTDELLRLLAAAKALDPLSSEPYMAEGRVWARMGFFREAMAAYLAGLDVNPRDVLLNFAVADLNFKAGVMSTAKDYLGRALKYEPNFHPALSRLGEISMLDIETIRGQLLIKQNAGEPVDYATELVPYLKEAAAFWTASLAIEPGQPLTQHALATLYLRLAELGPLTISSPGDSAEVRKAYLTKARDLSFALVVKARDYSTGSKPTRSDPRLRAEAPTLAAYNTWAFALYALGDVEGARAALEEHLRMALLKDAFADTDAMTAYQVSSALTYANLWLKRINENNRRYFEVVEFEKDSTDEYKQGWQVSIFPKSDTSFHKHTNMKGGKLELGVKQEVANLVSRLEIDKPWATLAEFEAEFTSTGDVAMSRGIHMTVLDPGTEANERDDPKSTILLGVDQLGRVYYETRRFRKDNAAQPEVVLDYGLVDVRSYGGLALNKDDRLKLALRRQPSIASGECEYVAVINGYDVVLPITDTDLKNQDFKTGTLKLRCGFYTQAGKSPERAAPLVVVVERARFIYDSGLGGS